MREVVEPTLRAMRAEGAPFCGVLFVGLMIEAGVPRILEFNVRFGDPEACVLVPLYEGNFGELLQNATKGRLPPSAPVAKGAALCVVMAAEGYPGKVATGDVIEGLDHTHAGTEFVLHAGTALRADGAVLTSGGRVLTVGAAASTLAQARDEAYAAVARIRWRGEQHRKDIGWRALP
jgi:phosphoribosylamine--glycine ligase